MDGPGMVASDILGVEVGRRSVRGVRLDQDRSAVTTAAEIRYETPGVSAEGILDVAVVGPAMEQLFSRLNIFDRSAVRVGLSIGPQNSGVGSGPAMAGWLETQAVKLQENMQCAGGLGIAFVPSRAMDAALKLAHEAGIDLARLDLAPVAAARAIGAQVDDRICIGSGHGWQARMRDLEVLEAMDNREVHYDAPLTLVDAKGSCRFITSYGFVEIAPELLQSGGLDVCQFAVAVGVAIGTAFQSPADLLAGKTVSCGVGESALQPNLAHLAGYDLSPDSAESTIRLNTTKSQVAATVDQARRETVESPRDTQSGVGRESLPTPESLANPQLESEIQPQPQLQSFAESEPLADPQSPVYPEPEAQPMPEAPAAPAERVTVRPPKRGSAARGSKDSSDLITMFSPDTEVQDMMGKRDRRIGIDVAVAVAVLLAIAVLVYLFVL